MDQDQLQRYRESAQEQERTASLLRLLPRNRQTVLDIGARDGHFSRLLTKYFPGVTALDLTKPDIDFPGVTNVAGDVTRLEFTDSSFDCVFCAEVLEHIPDVEGACREIARVTRHEVVIGVPYLQDTRVGRVTCASCKRAGPPWGHVNSFSLPRLKSLFPGWRIAAQDFVGESRIATNWASALLMDWAGNPWGNYHQEEPCVHCGAELSKPCEARAFWQRMCSFTAHTLNRMQAPLSRPHGNWVHLVFTRSGK